MLLIVFMLFASDHVAKNRALFEKEGNEPDSTSGETSLQKFFRNIFTLEKPDTNAEKSNYQDFSGKEGKIIRKINVKVLDLFGTSVYDTNMKPRGWLSKMGNMLHINTREWLVKNNLLFREGDILDSYQLSESERLLRQYNNIYDSRIIAVDVPNASDSVDVYVIVQDIWSLSADAAVNRKIDEGFLSLRDINFLGLGTEIGTKVKFSDQYSNDWAWDGSLYWNNIKRSFFNGRITKRTDADNVQWGMGINKDFFSPVVKWAGGIDMDFNRQKFWEKVDTSFVLSNLSFAVFDVWGGFATDFVHKKALGMNQNRFNFSLRVTRTNFSEKNVIDSLTLENNTFVLGRIGYAFKNFYKDRYIFGLGRTEDIPTGFIASFLYGYEFGDFSSKPYYGFYTGYSSFDYKIGYLYTGFQFGAFRDIQRWTYRTTGLNFLFISKLAIKGQFKWRHYIWGRFVFTEDPLFGNYITIDNNQGLRGAGTQKKGNKKVVFNYENNLFTPISILGFNLAFISFADLALLSDKNESLLSSKLYKGFGLGFRIRNEHLVAGTIQIMFGFYPGRDGRTFNVFEQSRSFYQFDQFRFGKPGIIQF